MEDLTILVQQRLPSHLCCSVLSRSATKSSRLEDMKVPVQEECPPSYREDYVYPYPEDEFITVKRLPGIEMF